MELWCLSGKIIPNRPAALRILITKGPLHPWCHVYLPCPPSPGTVKFREVWLAALAGAPPRLCWLIVPLSRTIYLGNLTWSEHAPNTRPHHTYINIAQCYANIHIQKSDKIFLWLTFEWYIIDHDQWNTSAVHYSEQTYSMSWLFSILCPPQSNIFPMQMTNWHQNPTSIILLSSVDLT